ncbi:MAG: hypothetical protein B2I17_07875 [Thermoplasmatales archaeon B_DKE]|nr:MAG: hypothetical protein B2I17_07875 [Thermoplasmatales archaeon B_DKE]
MNGETDYGIIMSALAMGDLRDVQARIARRMGKLRVAMKVTAGKNYDPYIRMLEGMQSVLSGKKSVDDFRHDLDNAALMKNFRFVGDWKDFVNTVSYYLYYFIDRYNIHLPEFDSKRSDDR